ncbi:uncharacterized protein LOC112126699 [Cimex lectularius]|uniref:Uncharacterized protein n=1 Tax=Cimex lectularius TaxID=79782 RepID=A0A8I6SI73_CIMLE|nr:uncharacterized protein LOC112126699 [Cimex lectularius]
MAPQNSIFVSKESKQGRKITKKTSLRKTAPAHKAQTTQQWLEENVPEFIKASDWPLGSQDLNPLDYKVWSHLELMACHRKHANLESPKSALLKAVEKFPQDVLHTAIDD